MEIWKYAVRIDDAEHDLSMPAGANVLHVGQQSKIEVCFWALVVPDAIRVVRRFRVFGTGQPLGNASGVLLDYLGTTLAPPFVWHLFELLDEENADENADPTLKYLINERQDK